MKDFKRLAHDVWEGKYHIVWCPKYRFRILEGSIGRSVRDIIKQLCEWKQVEILEGSVQIDHIPLVLSIPPKYSLSELVGFLKGKSAALIHRTVLGKKRVTGLHFWARGYCVSTVGLDEETIRNYIREQEKSGKEQLELEFDDE